MIEAIITVISCDRCKKVVCLRTDEEYEQFESTWYDATVYGYCPDCRITMPGNNPTFADANQQIELDKIF